VQFFHASIRSEIQVFGYYELVDSRTIFSIHQIKRIHAGGKSEKRRTGLKNGDGIPDPPGPFGVSHRPNEPSFIATKKESSLGDGA
jgi:hypothetical protein